jgi:transposase
MNFAAQLAQFNPDPALAEWLLAQFGNTQKEAEQFKLQAQTSACQITALSADVRNKELKIQALTLELAYHKRLKFGAKAESFAGEQRDLFIASSEEDLSAMQTELEALSPATPRSKAKPTGRKALPADLPRIEHRHEPQSCSCTKCGNGLVQIA